jgi:hypothetical protein
MGTRLFVNDDSTDVETLINAVNTASLSRLMREIRVFLERSSLERL